MPGLRKLGKVSLVKLSKDVADLTIPTAWVVTNSVIFPCYAAEHGIIHLDRYLYRLYDRRTNSRDLG
jgi:hypothetical protein